jgi:D-alanyl-D-alanine carboxypeptidase
MKAHSQAGCSKTMRSLRLCASAALLYFSASAQAQLASGTETQVAEIANAVLRATGVPSASIGIVSNGHVYARAFGLAQVTPPVAAMAEMAYPVGSISKQFTAAAILLLQQQGRLSIDDPVAKYFPKLTRANEITLRNLLTMTSGYQDFAPQDYSIPAWYAARKPQETVEQWAGKPLDFEPGTQWQYSNTNYVLLGLIVEKVSGEPFDKFLRENVLDAAHLTGVFNAYTQRGSLKATGYISYALQPPRILPLEAPGWYFAAAELAMPVRTLIDWDRTLIDRSLLSETSYRQMDTAFVTKDGRNTGYGLGVKVRTENGHLRLEHGGEVGGYVAENIVYPNDGIAIAVLTNQVASGAAAQIGEELAAMLLPAAAEQKSKDTTAEVLPHVLSGLAKGQVDRRMFTADCNAYFSPEAIIDFEATLSPLGAVRSVYRTESAQRGGMQFAAYRVVFGEGTTLLLDTYTLPDGKLEQLLIISKE